MAMNPETYEEFQRQLELQKQEETAKKESKTRVDDDGTEYEWDESKKAWFPKLSVELMMKYQSNYATGEGSETGQTSTYTDPATNILYSWNMEKNRWEPTSLNNNKTDPCRYTDQSGTTYMWNIEKGTWELDPKSSSQVTKTSEESTNNNEKKSSEENSTEKQDGEKLPQQEKSEINESHTYTDPSSGVMYTWNNERQLWVSNTGLTMLPSNTAKYTDEKTGVSYTWDHTEQQWITDKTTENKKEKKKNKKDKEASKRKASQPTWFKAPEEKNNNVYVQGLPPDIHLEEFAELMHKCGIIMPNPITGKPKLKLYKDKEGNLKGDGLCCYLKKESIDLAIQLLDDTEIRGGYRIHVQKANFELKGSYDPSKKPKMLSKKEKAKLQKEQEKLLDWKLARREDVKKSDRVLIFKNMFDPKDFEVDAVLITEIRDDLRKECEKFGDVKKVIVFDRHPDGVCSVSFKDFDEAGECQKAMNKRWFDKRQIQVEPWDGTTDYQIEETDREREERLKHWEEFLLKDDQNAKEDSDQHEQVASHQPE